MLAYSEFCKDGLMMGKVPKLVVIIRCNNIMLCRLKPETILLSVNLVTQRDVLCKDSTNLSDRPSVRPHGSRLTQDGFS